MTTMVLPFMSGCLASSNAPWGKRKERTAQTIDDDDGGGDKVEEEKKKKKSTERQAKASTELSILTRCPENRGPVKHYLEHPHAP